MTPNRRQTIMWSRDGLVNWRIYASLVLNELTKTCCAISDDLRFPWTPPSAAYIRQWIRSTLVEIMACRLFGAKLSSEPMLGYCPMDPKEQTSAVLIKIPIFFIHEIASENVVSEMAAILSRGELNFCVYCGEEYQEDIVLNHNGDIVRETKHTIAMTCSQLSKLMIRSAKTFESRSLTWFNFKSSLDK